MEDDSLGDDIAQWLLTNNPSLREHCIYVHPLHLDACPTTQRHKWRWISVVTQVPRKERADHLLDYLDECATPGARWTWKIGPQPRDALSGS